MINRAIKLALIASLLSTGLVAVASEGTMPSTDTSAASDTTAITMPGAPLGVAWGFLYGFPDENGHPMVKAEEYLSQLRKMGGGFTKVYLMWSQIEREKGKYDWGAVDAF